MSKSIIRASSAVAIASLFGGFLSLSAVAQTPPQQPAAATAKPTAATPEETARATLRSETRIRRLHDKLEITAAEEALWTPVAQVMRDNNAEFHRDLGEKTADMKSPTAVTDLKTFQIIADHHAAGLKKLLPAFDALYQSLPPAQQKRADRVFSERFRSDRM